MLIEKVSVIAGFRTRALCNDSRCIAERATELVTGNVEIASRVLRATDVTVVTTADTYYDTSSST